MLSELIDAPARRVFELAADIPRAAERIDGISKVEMLTEGPIGVGTRWRETRSGMGTEELTITDFDPPRGYSVGAESCGCRFESQFLFSPSESGEHTLVELITRWQPVSWYARLMSPLSLLMSGMMKKAMAKDLADLKRAAEES